MTSPNNRAESVGLFAVACQGANSLALVDTRGERRGDISVGADPVDVATAANRVFVATMGERSVTVVESGGAVDRVMTGVLGPAHVTRLGERLLVPCTAGDAVAVLDPLEPSLEGRVSTGAEPHDVGVAGELAVAGSRVDGVITVFDPESRAVVATYEIPEPETARIQGVDGGGTGRVYAVDQGNDRLLLLDRDGVCAAAAVGADPYEASVVGDRVYVPGRSSDTVHEFARDLTDSVVHQTAAGPEGVVSVDGDPWVFHRESSVFCSLDGRAVTLPEPSLAVTSLADGQTLLSHYADDAVSLVDVDAATVVWTVETPACPVGSVAV
jgi:hypothetical protein